MNTNTSRSTRDTSFAGFAMIVGGIIGSHLNLGTEETIALSIGLVAVITFGWRVLRHYAPWVSES